MPLRSIRRKLVLTFTAAILVPSLLTAVAGVEMIRRRVFAQAQAQVDSDLEAARTIYASHLDRLQDLVAIHAARMPSPQEAGSEAGRAWKAELSEALATEGLDTLTWVGPSGEVIFRAGNLSAPGGDLSSDPLVRRALKSLDPVSSTGVLDGAALAAENPTLPWRARMDVIPTPRSRLHPTPMETSGLLLRAAVPGPSEGGRTRGVLSGGILLNRNFEIVDTVRRTIFKEEVYGGKEVGTATIFLGDVRVSTNVKSDGGRRAVATLASAEVAKAVLDEGRTWRGRAFVVNDWYLAAYAPIRDLEDRTVGMLYVGILERPFRDSLLASLAVFLGIALLGVALVTWAALRAARSLSGPIHQVAEAAGRVARGDFTPRVEVAANDEVGLLAESFNRMAADLDLLHREQKDWARTLELKVEARTRELEALQEDLVRAHKLAAVGTLAAGVAHEINNPLTAVLTNSSLLLHELPEGDPRREDLQMVVDETLRCRRIVRSLLDFSRQSPARKVPMNLNRAVKDAQALMRGQPSFRGVSLFNHLSADLPEVYADPDQIRQVLVNLFLNAAESMPEGGQIVITTGLAQAPGFVELSIADSGEGLPEAIRERLFEPFATTKRTGTGLGLAVVYGILEAHGGRIELEPSAPRGTVARVLLPRAGAEAKKEGTGGGPPKGDDDGP